VRHGMAFTVEERAVSVDYQISGLQVFPDHDLWAECYSDAQYRADGACSQAGGRFLGERRRATAACVGTSDGSGHRCNGCVTLGQEYEVGCIARSRVTRPCVLLLHLTRCRDIIRTATHVVDEADTVAGA